jgi:hypothetical protein
MGIPENEKPPTAISAAGGGCHFGREDARLPPWQPGWVSEWQIFRAVIPENEIHGFLRPILGIENKPLLCLQQMGNPLCSVFR